MNLSKSFFLILIILVHHWTFAQRCGCFVNQNIPDNYLYTNKITATNNSKSISLSHGQEITPEANKPVYFKFIETPNIIASCKNTYRIVVEDESTHQIVNDAQSDFPDRLSYAFPNCDRAYTVTFSVKASNKKALEENLTAQVGQSCKREMVIIIKPTCKQCNCIAELGKNTLTLSGKIIAKEKNKTTNQYPYDIDIQIVNESDCEIKIVSFALGKSIIKNPNITLAKGAETTYRNTQNSLTFIGPLKEADTNDMINIRVVYMLNRQKCQQDITILYIQK